jgi:hypothetical protein
MLAACYSLAQAQESNGASDKSPSKGQQIPNKTKAAQYPTKDSPLPVIVLPSPEDAKHAASRERTADKFNGDYLDSQIRLAKASEKQAIAAVAAAVVVGVETVIAGFALCFLMRTYRETKLTARASIKAALAAKKSAHAANLSAKAAIGVELPKVFLSECRFGDMGAASWAAKLQRPKLEMAVSNYGRTPAFAIEHSINFICAITPPEIPNYDHTYPFPIGTVIREPPFSLLVLRHSFSDEEVADMEAGKKSMWVYGYVSFKDFLNEEHKCRFAKKHFRMPWLLANAVGGDDRYSFVDWDENRRYTESY